MKKLILTAIFLASLSLQAKAESTLNCNGMGDVKGQSVTLTIVSNTLVKVDGTNTAVLDEQYNPRLNQGFLRFDYDSSEEGDQEVLVQEQLLEGSSKGLIKVQWRGEGFETSSYYCHP